MRPSGWLPLKETEQRESGGAEPNAAGWRRAREQDSNNARRIVVGVAESKCKLRSAEGRSPTSKGTQAKADSYGLHSNQTAKPQQRVQAAEHQHDDARAREERSHFHLLRLDGQLRIEVIINIFQILCAFRVVITAAGHLRDLFEQSLIKLGVNRKTIDVQGRARRTANADRVNANAL